MLGLRPWTSSDQGRKPHGATCTTCRCWRSESCCTRTGWRARYLGADTPLADLTRRTADLRPDLVVPTVTTPDRLNGMSEPLTRLARLAPLALDGARLLTDDPITAAERIPPSRSRWDSVRQRPGADETLEIKADGSNR